LEVTKLTVPDTLAPFAGELIVTESAGAAVEVGAGVEVSVRVGVEVAVEVRVGAGRCFAAIALPRPTITINNVIATIRR
jgi:hypothetical protein